MLYVVNEDKVLVDIARGRGEYYLGLTQLWGCEQASALREVESLRPSLPELLKLGTEEQYKLIKEKIRCQKMTKG